MSKILLILTLLWNMLHAYEETFPFIGVTVSTQTIDLKSATAPSKKENHINIRYGQQSLDWRTTFALGGNKALQTFSIEIDKILMDNMFGRPELRPYLGATVGYLKYKGTPLLKNSGVYYGGNFGFLLYITDKIDADISYHYYDVDKLTPLNGMKGGSIGFNFFY